MQRPLVLAALLALAAAGPLGAQTPEPAKPEGHAAVGAPLAPGANSFTEAQVKERFAKMGFAEVRDLRKDESGIWRGIATHAGKDVRVGMDFKGNVAAQ